MSQYTPSGQSAPSQGQQQQGHSQSHKSGGAFGQMMNQAVTTGKPMFDKLSKTISSKLGNKPAAGAPQHLQNYQNYQDQHAPQSPPVGYQQQGQTFSPPPQQQQWQQSQAPNAYSPAQNPSPYQPSNYASPAPGYSGQGNYFPPQAPYTPNSQAPQTPLQSPNMAGHGSVQAGQTGLSAQMQSQQGHQGQYGQGLPQGGQYQNQPLQGGLDGQQMGVTGGSQIQSQPQYGQSPHLQDTSPAAPAPPVPQSQYGYPLPTSPPQQSLQPVQSQYGYPLPGHEQTSSLASQQPSSVPMVSSQLHHPAPSTSTPQDYQQQGQWNPASQMSSHGQSLEQSRPPSVSPPPPLHIKPKPQSPLVAHPQQPQPQPPTPGSQHTVPQSSMSEFIAELPADLGELSLMKTKPLEPHSFGQASSYQAFQPSLAQSGSPSSGFAIPRRDVSTNSVPFTDPWRFADPVTELPTREFYALADLLFDALDKKFEPKNTGMLEAPKVIGSWVDLSEDASRLYAYKSYSALAKMWALEGVPHLMVPCQPTLNPVWNFTQQSHAQELRLIAEAPSPLVMYPTYMPALNRAGWYKFFFLEVMHEPDSIDRLLQAHCSDSYNPSGLNHPDVNKRDKAESPALRARAEAIQMTAIMRVCNETKAAMLVDPDVPAQPSVSAQPAAGSSLPPGSPEDVAVRMHKIQMERQFNDTAVKTVLGGGITFAPTGGYGGGYASLV